MAEVVAAQVRTEKAHHWQQHIISQTSEIFQLERVQHCVRCDVRFFTPQTVVHAFVKVCDEHVLVAWV
jgi:hypothetical protein